MTFPCYVSRDSDQGGALSELFDLWISRPTRYDLGRGAFWLTEDPSQHYGQHDQKAILALCKVIPDTDLQLIRVG